MFMPETEDMLPREAPRPSAPIPLGHTEEIVKPTVPEVSILFGQPPQQPAQLQQTQQQHQQPQHQLQLQTTSMQRPANSFASWKKQILPRVNFSPILATELGPCTQQPAPSATACNDYNFLPRTRGFEAERTSPMQLLGGNGNLGYAVPGPSHYPRETYSTEDLVSATRLPQTATNDVLTICASTQTEPEAMLSAKDAPLQLEHLADKKDIRQILTLLDSIRQEQHQLRLLYESLAQKQQQLTSSKIFKETGVQCAMVMPNKGNATVKRTTPIVQDYIVEEDEHVPARALPQFQSPRTAPPMAQSTGYRNNTPQGKQLPVPATNGPPMSKPITDKTLVMNELALKYLPQRQIHELMDELQVSPKTANDIAGNTGANTTPLRRTDNFTESPSNMSNASYKYLKKYRLLPEEHLGYDHHMVSPQAVHKLQRTGSPAVTSPQCQEPMLDLDNIRNQPKLL